MNSISYKRILKSIFPERILQRLYLYLNTSREQRRFAIQVRLDSASAILLTGSGRSGTTWAVDVGSGMQVIFGPLHPSFYAEVRPSRRTRVDQFIHESHKHLGDWKRAMSSDNQQRVMDWVHRFGLDFYTRQVLPSPATEEQVV